MKTKLLVILTIFLLDLRAFAQEVVDVSDPKAIKLNTPDKGVQVCGILHDCIANYPKLKDQLIGAAVKQMESLDELSAQRYVMELNVLQGVEIPRAAMDIHNARIVKFAKTKEDALNAATKKSIVSIKIDSTESQDQVDAKLKALHDARELAARAKAKRDELISLRIPISAATQQAVEAAQAKPGPTPSPTPSPSDGL
jgi:hypothetical protein